MKKYNSIFKFFVILFTTLLVVSCVHDDKYDDPDLNGTQCLTADHFTDPANGYTKWTLAQLKALADNTEITDNAYIEGYVSSSDESGNIYKTIYVQDNFSNPDQGLTVSVDMVSTYTKYPQGSKVYIKLKGLFVSSYGGVKQLGQKTAAGTRLLEKEVPNHIFRDCNIREEIVPKVMTLAQMITANDKYIGCLIQINNTEFDKKILCSNYAPNAETVDRTIGEGWTGSAYTKTAVVRNSGYASFANKQLPAGKGTFLGIFSKYNSTYQMYINRDTDLNMNTFPRLDGITANPCEYSDAGLTQKTVAEVKQLVTSPLTLITGDYVLKAKVTANDRTGNLFKYIYVEDATGGIRVNIDKASLYGDPRFYVGKELYIKLKDLYVGAVNGEIQLGSPNGAVVGRIAEANVYKHFFDSKKNVSTPVPTERTISELTAGDVGKWVKIKDLQFVDSDLEKVYAAGVVTNRTLTDCSGKTIILRTSNFATFASATILAGKGDVYAILSVFNGTYQLWIPEVSGVNLSNPRCDGSVYVPLPVIYSDAFAAGGFSGTDWTAVSVVGAQAWTTSNQGNGTNYYAMMNGFSGSAQANEDWLISKEISLAGKTKAAVNFTSDVRYAGNALQVYATSNYTGNPSTTTWTLLSATLDTNTAAFGDWVNSGNLNLDAFAGGNVRIAFKYTSTTSAASTWEIDDFKVKAQ